MEVFYWVSFDSGLHNRASLVFQFAREFHDQDSVLCRQPHEHEQADLDENVVVTVAQPHARDLVNRPCMCPALYLN